MGVAYNPRLITDGLVSSFDATNIRNFPTTTPIREHGFSEWYCFVTSTVTYSIVDAGVSIVERQTNGTLTTMVATSSGPTRGTFTITAGRTYYGVGGPINLVTEDQHHYIAPLTMVGTQFIWWAARSTPGTVYIYSPFKDTTIKFWDNPASGGITNTSPTSVTTLSAGGVTSFTFTSPANFETIDTLYLTSTEPVLVTTTQNGTDKTILSPASKYVYQRFLTLDASVIQTVPASRQNGCISDPTHSVMSMNIADGAGGDCTQGLGLEFLSDRYSWGNVLSDYVISCPYNGTVTASYWNGSAWVVRETHTITGATLQNPIVISRDGTAGVGVNATNLSGAVANMVSDSTTLWKWEGTVPFYLCINDSADDEFSVLGWMNTRVTRRNSNQYLRCGVGTDQLTVHGSLIYNSSGIGTVSTGIGTTSNAYYSFPTSQVSNYLMQTPYAMPTGNHTISCWFRSRFNDLNQTPYTYSVSGDNTYLLFTDSSTIIAPHSFGDKYPITVPSMTNKWCNFTRTRVASTGMEVYYMNGVQVGSRIVLPGTLATSGGNLIIGQEADADAKTNTGSFDVNQNLDGDFARLDIYNRALSADEVLTNFNATKIRFNENFGTEPQSIISNGLVFHVDPTNPNSYTGISTTNLYDLSGSQNHLSWSPSLAPTFQNYNNNIVLRTTSTYTSRKPVISSSYNGMRTLTGSYTAFAIFRPNSTSVAKILVSFGPANNNCGGQNVHPISIGQNGKFVGGACGGLGTWNSNVGATPTTTRFWCVATTYDGTTESVYVDGALEKTAAMTSSTPVSSQNAIGLGWIKDDGAAYSMDADIGVIMIYNRALSAAEISQNFTTLRGRFGI